MGGHRIYPPFRPDRPGVSGALLSRRAWRAGLKNPEEVMEILEAFDLTGTMRGAAELAGYNHKTVAHWVRARDEAGGVPGGGAAAAAGGRVRGEDRGVGRSLAR